MQRRYDVDTIDHYVEKVYLNQSGYNDTKNQATCRSSPSPISNQLEEKKTDLNLFLLCSRVSQPDH